MMVGFDHDGPDKFVRASPIPIFTLSALVAPAATPLFVRMKQEARLIDGGSDVAGTPWDTNIIPSLMRAII